ncbi:CopL family metal-binding regulatory protein [Lysobacter sp. 5GHs7-4]|uniref:CopL family metal-binding regulatory protein n=1 Tax=Lysobacter sp. 5GHs7-4 TaxID=2904253 RepID=UPI001E3976EC|nr:CopL family metal-binding regulatory protein [Lysobacter sp. 5GHs7-4]UHQ21538.1 CopL family metal-binding regulatory protein [Lysobacter sp. 5GHs7-4]
MFTYGTLLRCLLIVAFCLEGTLSLWSSSAMAAQDAVAAATRLVAADGALVADADCEEDRPHDEQGRAPHRDCDCGTGSGCCACAFPVVAAAHGVPFAAQHRLAVQPRALASARFVPAVATGVFRPPIV